jgi:hypothetical protein
VKLSPLVRTEVLVRFSPEDAPRVLAALEKARLPFLERPSQERTRVHLGILKVAEGTLEGFRYALRLAKEDWRDLLVEAGLADDNWEKVLARAGFPVP